MAMGHAAGVLPRVEDVMDDFLQPHTVFDLGKDEGAGAAHFKGVAFHPFQIRAHGFG
jgi:hypothetical protein